MDSGSGTDEKNVQPSSTNDEPGLCFVCNDISTGYHYGTPSCNGCKTFFRRTIMKKQTFKCQFNGNCSVDKKLEGSNLGVRCACRYCRFEKCLAVGMSKDAIQQNRDPIGYTKRTRRYPNSAHANVNTSLSPHSPSMSPTAFEMGVDKFESLLGSGLGGLSGTSFQPILGQVNMGAFGQNSLSSVSSTSSSVKPAGEGHQLTRVQIAEDALMGSLMKIEKRIEKLRNSQITLDTSLVEMVLRPSMLLDEEFIRRQIVANPTTLEGMRRAQQADYQFWHHRDWLIMIEWAKTIPVYQQLSLADKLALLRHSAITHPSLLQCFYTPDYGPDTIVFPNGAYFDRHPDPDRPAGFERRKFKMLDNLLAPMRKMRIDMNEFAACKAIFFLNPDADDLSALEVKSALNDCRAAVINALYRYMVERHGREVAVDRFGKLLLLGTVIATLAVEAKEAVVVADFFEQIHLTSFAKQLLFGLRAAEDGGTTKK